MNKFTVVAGSRLYGTHRPDSDYDFRGVYLESKEQILGLHEAQTIETKEPDTVYYPLKSFIRLALANNPNILEILFATEEYRVEREGCEFFRPFLAHRHAFLSQRARNTYMGYAYSQLKKVEEGKSPTKNTRQHLIEQFGYDTKYAAHTMRLLNQGMDILLTGNFDPTLSGYVLQYTKQVLAGEWKKEEFITWAYEMIHALKHVVVELPWEPDTQLIESLVIQCYEEYL